MQCEASDIKLYDHIPQLKAAVSEAHQRNDQDAEAVALSRLGDAYCGLGEPECAVACYERYLEVARAMGHALHELVALNSLGNAHTNLRQFRRAIRCYEEHLSLACAYDNRQHEGIALNNLGSTYVELRKWKQAHQCYERYLVLTWETRDLQAEAFASRNLGLLCDRRGDLEQAASLLEVYIDFARHHHCDDYPDLEQCSAKLEQIKSRLHRAASKSRFWWW
jgi:tetratricopeptide (TPR) repeat protein